MRRILLGLIAVTAVAVLAVVLLRRGRDTGGADSAATSLRPAVGRGVPGAAAAPTQGLTGEHLDLDDDPAGTELLEGQVIDEREQPVAGARVMLDSLPGRVAVTGLDGGFEFDRLIARTYVLEARRDDSAAGPVSTRLTADSEPVILRLRPAARVEIEVVDAGAAPVAGALVELRHVGVVQESSDGGGLAVLRGVNPGTHVLKVAAAGYASVWSRVTVSGAAGEVVRKRVQLRAGVAVAGTVVDPSGRPVEGARVTAEPTSLWDLSDRRLDAVLTDAKGRWQLTGLARQTFRFRAFHPELAPGFSELVQLTDGAARDNVVIRLELGGRLAGRVIDAAGAPVAGARVQAASDSIAGGPTRRTHSDADGRFSLGGLPRTRVSLVATGESATSPLVDVDLSTRPQRDDLELRLELTGVIAGRVVTSSGQPVAEARVVAAVHLDETFGEGLEQRLRGPSSDVADQEGRFHISGLTPGKYRVRAIRPGSSVELLQMKPGVVVDSGTVDATLTVDDLTSMSGQVRFRNGGEPELFQVRLGGSAPRGFTGPGGRFHIEEVPAGRHVLTISGPELVMVHRDDVTLTAGRDNDLGVIEVDRGRRIRGRVTAGGAGVAGAQVLIGPDLEGDGWGLMRSREPLGAKQAVSGADGSFLFNGIGTTTLVLVAERDGQGRSAAVEIKPGTADLTIDLAIEPYGSLTGHLRVNGRPPASGLVFVRPPTAANLGFSVQTGTDGSYHFDRLAPGAYLAFGVLGVDSGSEGGSGRRVVIRSGATETVDFDLVEGNIEVAVRIRSAGEVVQYGYGVLVRIIGELPAVLPTTIGEGRRVLAQSAGGEIHEGLIMKDRQIVFRGIAPGDYVACINPLPGPPDDPAVMAQMQANLVDMSMYCRHATITAAPLAQSVEVDVKPWP